MTTRRAFTLIELLVVVAIIALLIAILIPSLAHARETARTSACAANLHGIGNGLVVYHTENDGFVVPSYNMTGSVGGVGNPLDGWAPILDRDGVIRQSSGTDTAGSARNNVFYCPSTLDLAGMMEGNDKPFEACRGWMDWPSIRESNAVNYGVTIPDRGFNHIIRVAYWINADNPIGNVSHITPNRYYTSSVGYQGANGVMHNSRFSNIKRPAAMVVLADGLYAGRQGNSRPDDNKSRIGFRHGNGKLANVAFADGHAETVRFDQFPRSDRYAENMNHLTIYTDPEKFLTP